MASFWFGQLSAIVEPVAGVLGAVAVLTIEPMLPYALAFAAGAMIYVVVEEVIPETQRDRYTDVATLGFILGFVLMMVLDVVLGVIPRVRQGRFNGSGEVESAEAPRAHRRNTVPSSAALCTASVKSAWSSTT